MKKILFTSLMLFAILAFCLASCVKFTFSVTFIVDGETYDTITTNGKETVKFPKNPEKEGYTFEGWYLDNNTWNEPFTANSLLDMPLSFDNEVTVFAKFVKNELCDVHDFNENNVCKNCGYKPDVKSTCTITFDSNGGSTIPSQEVKKGETIKKPENPKRDGYIFDGWYLGDELWSFAGYPVNADMTLTAKWTPITYEVKFVDENDNLITTQTVIKGSKIVKPTDPKKDGCTFVGWFDIGVVWDFDSNTVKQNLTLKTKWVAYVTYNLDGGFNSSENPNEIYSDSSLPISLHNPNKDGYTFAGWYADEQFTIKVDSITSCTHHVLYALWIKEPQYVENFPWTPTTIRISISESSDSQQLRSSARRYLAGDLSQTEGGGDKVDVFVSDRNSAAREFTGVSPEYRYLPDTAMYAWSQSIAYINAQVTSGDVETPDVFVNFVYDMVTCSLLGNFANLRSTTMYEDGHELYEQNYFQFVNPTEETPVDDFGLYEDTGKGYMYDYMQSLTLSKAKMYCIASDYFIDAVRASMVIPVNIEMLETYIAATSTYGQWNSDRAETFDKDGNVETAYTIEDLYELVYAGGWNYDALAKFSEAVAGTEGEGKITDTEGRLGFALGADTGLPASGMLYSTPIVIVNREYDVTTGDYTYSYPYTQKNADGTYSFYEDLDNPDDTFDELVDFYDRLSTLMGTNGIITASLEKDGVHSTESVRDAFVNGRLLFGGITLLGGLEQEDYATLNGEGKSGYGIVPVPLYKETLGAEDYITQLHNNAKVGAIAFSTKNFAQCTAYLDYQSTHSYDILTEYYNSTLSKIVEEGSIGSNTEMLQMIRANVRSSFDKAYEDALGEFYKGQTGGTSDEQKWHNIIKAANFEIGQGMRREYSEVVGLKAKRLYDLETIVFPALPI